jgi:hypothetical protein
MSIEIVTIPPKEVLKVYFYLYVSPTGLPNESKKENIE